MRLLFSLLIVPLLSGCVLIAAGLVDAIGVNEPADEATVKKFQDLCAAGSGLQIFQRAENVNGVFDATFKTKCGLCEHALVSAKYSFVEFEISADDLPRSPKQHFFDQAYVTGLGFHRAVLKPAHHPDCKIFYDYHSNYWPGSKEASAEHLAYIHKKLGNHCIATTPIQKVTTQYAFREFSKETVIRERLFKQKIEWSNYKNGELFATYTKYTLNKTIKRHKGGFYPSEITETISCPMKDNSEYAPPSVEDVFARPKQISLN
tara:strand:- start:379 stop:1164 length:786 start_codon:yes stop_codon:yes gene_type:complete